MIKLNEIVSNYKLYSALEQFEVLTLLQCPELGFFGFILFIFLPRIFVTNLNLFIILTFTYLFGFFDLKKNAIFNNEFNALSTSKISYDLPTEVVFFTYLIIKFVYSEIMENVQYDKHIYFNYALTLFIFIATFNVFGMIPYSLTVTSYISITLALSGMSFFANLLLTFSGHGGQFVKFFLPKGVNGALLILMIVIETISYITRLFSMAIRLFANMLSGHALVKILSGLVILSFSEVYLFGIINILFNLIVIAVTALEVIVAVLQAYVFVMLSVVYTNEAVVLH